MDHDDLDGYEDLTPPDDPLVRPATDSAERHAIEPATRSKAWLGISLPSAIVGVLLVGAIAFGANVGLAGSTGDEEPTAAAKVVGSDVEKEPVKPDTAVPTKAPRSGPTGKAEPADELNADPEPTKKPTPEPAKKATPEPTKKPTPEPAKKATPEPTKKPTPEPAKKAALDLALAVKDGAVVVKWSVCEVDGADTYKVVRSSDSTVTWPTGDGDELIAAIGVDGTPKAWDKGAPAGKKAWYRVFCVRHTDGGYKVLAASGVGEIVAPESAPKPTPKPTPETYVMWIEAGIDGGAVVLHWEACASDGFSHYRIVRKADGDASVIAEIGDQGTTTYVDAAVAPGSTYHYVVQAKGQVDGEWVLLGTTEWVGVTVG